MSGRVYAWITSVLDSDRCRDGQYQRSRANQRTGGDDLSEPWRQAEISSLPP